MTEIEKELNRRADIIIRQEKQIQIDAEQIRALQKQNGELTDKVKELETDRLQWHDLRKDPNDLPQKYIPVLNQHGEHRSYDGHYWRDCDDVIYTDVIAWCEVPEWEIKEK